MSFFFLAHPVYTVFNYVDDTTLACIDVKYGKAHSKLLDD